MTQIRRRKKYEESDSSDQEKEHVHVSFQSGTVEKKISNSLGDNKLSSFVGLDSIRQVVRNVGRTDTAVLSPVHTSNNVKATLHVECYSSAAICMHFKCQFKDFLNYVME